MKPARLIAIAVAACALAGACAAADADKEAAREILALETKVMDGWQAGNPDAALAVLDPEITYFHIFTEQRVEGLAALKAMYESYRGRPLFDRYEISAPKVQIAGDTAVLTYILVRHVGGETSRWNSTQVYVHRKDGWKVLHAHWSTTKPS